MSVFPLFSYYATIPFLDGVLQKKSLEILMQNMVFFGRVDFSSFDEEIFIILPFFLSDDHLAILGVIRLSESRNISKNVIINTI